MRIKTSKSPKLRDFICVICKKPFQNYLSPSEIKKGFGKVCSKSCKNILNRDQKRNGYFKKCLTCNSEFYVSGSDSKFHNTRWCSVKCSRAKDKTHNTDHYGYAIIYIKGIGSVKEHRYIMEQHLGRKLSPNEIVHHKDHNKKNNAIKNLEVLTRAQHNREHFKINDGLTNTQRFNLRHKKR